MQAFWWMLLIVSTGLLALILIRNPSSRQWLGYLALNVVLAAFILYFINLVGAKADFHIPINTATVTTIGILGVPGILLLVALKLSLF